MMCAVFDGLALAVKVADEAANVCTGVLCIENEILNATLGERSYLAAGCGEAAATTAVGTVENAVCVYGEVFNCTILYVCNIKDLEREAAE